jgi:membrane AbrB-like protein
VPLSRSWIPIATALAIGSIGGALAFLTKLPLAWMIGAMAATTTAAIAGVRVAIPVSFRMAMVAILGVMLGSAFSPAILQRLDEWVVSLCALSVYVAVSMAVAVLYFRRIGGYDLPTAYFSAAPGGLSEMVMMGAEMGGRLQVISLIHGSRILYVVLILPFAFKWLEAYQPGLSRAGGAVSLLELPPLDLAVLAGCAVVGFAAARLARLPAASIIGPMFFSAIVHFAGITSARPPIELTAAAQVVIGAAIGCRFAGTAPREIARTALVALGATLVMLAVTGLMALLVHAITDLQADALILALAPGGLAEMSLIAIALGIDAAFVSTHHIVRIFLIVVLAAPLFRTMYRPPALAGRSRASSGAE